MLRLELMNSIPPLLRRRSGMFIAIVSALTRAPMVTRRLEAVLSRILLLVMILPGARCPWSHPSGDQ